ncbi:MAG: hypothetical protein SGCHY_001691, partial [Lobulomycetales sp.]
IPATLGPDSPPFSQPGTLSDSHTRHNLRDPAFDRICSMIQDLIVSSESCLAADHRDTRTEVGSLFKENSPAACVSFKEENCNENSLEKPTSVSFKEGNYNENSEKHTSVSFKEAYYNTAKKAAVITMENTSVPKDTKKDDLQAPAKSRVKIYAPLTHFNNTSLAKEFPSSPGNASPT